MENANIKLVFKYQNYEKMASLLGSTIENAINENISKDAYVISQKSNDQKS